MTCVGNVDNASLRKAPAQKLEREPYDEIYGLSYFSPENEKHLRAVRTHSQQQQDK